MLGRERGINVLSRGILATALLIFAAAPVFSGAPEYEQEFAREITEFANLNRLNLDRLHRDIHADCYIPVTIAAVIASDGSLQSVSVVKSSTVPVVDRYIVYVTEYAAPFPPLSSHYDPVPETITITYEFRLDVTLWGHGVRSTRPCEELEPRS